MDRCGHPVRGTGGDPCQLEKGHRGNHAQFAYICDGCGQPRRYPPYARHSEAGDYCFLCSGPTRENVRSRYEDLR